MEAGGNAAALSSPVSKIHGWSQRPETTISWRRLGTQGLLPPEQLEGTCVAQQVSQCVQGSSLRGTQKPSIEHCWACRRLVNGEKHGGLSASEILRALRFVFIVQKTQYC